MRRVPVLTLASLLGVIALAVSPVYSATLYGNDTPDIRLMPGAAADSVFDLNDFFDSATEANISYSGDGVTDGVVSVPGSATAGQATVSFTAQAGGESLTVDSVVQYSSFMIANVPAIDNNNRLAGVAGGNAFLNAIVPGSSVSSVENLELVGGGDFSSLTGEGATASASLIATIGEVSVSQTETGLYVRSSSVLGAGSANGLTATLESNGSYTLAADANFVGPVVVTLGAESGDSADAVHVLAAKATEVALAEGVVAMGPDGGPAASIAYANGNATITAAPGEGLLVISPAAIETGMYATVSLNFDSSSSDASLAVVAFDGAIAANTLAYNLVKGAGTVQANASKNLAVTAMLKSGSVLPGFQVFNPTLDEITVSISDLTVSNAGPLADYALNPNAKGDLSIASDLTNVDGLAGYDQNPADEFTVVGGVADGDNNFLSANGAGCMKLVASGTEIANSGIIPATIDTGTYVAECFVKKVASNGGTFFLVVTDGSNESYTKIATDAIGTGWEKVINTGSGVEGQTFVVVQSLDATVLVDDLSVRLVADSENFIDLDLLGL